jgi:uncharacterized membrane protein YjjB (DUF3815 family)
MILNSFFALVTTIGFGILFNIKGRKLYYCGLGGGLSWLVFLFCQKIGASTLLAIFVAASVSAAYGEILSRITRAPATTFVICAIIPLVPGLGMYKTMLGVVHADIKGALSSGLETIFTAGAVAVGLFLVSIFSKLFWFWFGRLFKP